MSSPPAIAVYIARKPGMRDPAAERAARLLGVSDAATTRVYVLAGLEDSDDARRDLTRLLADPVQDDVSFETDPAARGDRRCLEISRRSGVTEPVEGSVLHALELLGHEVSAVHLLRRTWLPADATADEQAVLGAARRWLASDVIEEARLDPPPPSVPPPPSPYRFERVVWPLRDLDDEALIAFSSAHTLSLTVAEMRTIRDHFRELGRDPTDIEVESLAQTWSEHCKHKTLTGRIEFDGRVIDNLLSSTIKRVTEVLDRDWCWSVFKDNAGIIAIDDELGVAFKVETHNHPSAIEPYGGAGTGIGGVIRDILGTGLGARPIASTDVFCFGDPWMDEQAVPRGSLHPRRVMQGVVAGVRDYGNRMGIPTVNGAVCFDDRYVGNPLVFCGTLGVIPRQHVEKAAQPGDLIVAAGGRTGRDGIHGATFSSMELSEESETVSSGAVQIGDPITEKKVLDVLLEARDRGLYSGITDCGAGGFSSAVGEMGELIGARVHLERAPLKYTGLSYTEIWISEAQERMVMSAPPGHVEELLALFESEDVEAFVLGEFTDTGRLELLYEGELVGDLSMEFLHDGLPRATYQATWTAPPVMPFAAPEGLDPGEALEALLSQPGIASKEWIIRQYDHEVQGATIGKPLVGTRQHGPADAAVMLVDIARDEAIAVASGINVAYGDLDPYRMGKAVVDEAMRNLAAVGAPLDRVALLDNFSWANCKRPEQLGSLVLAAEGACDVALAHGAPFISGKDSLNNELATADGVIAIPPTLLISAVAIVPEPSRTLSMDCKRAGNRIYLVGETRDELGGSELGRWLKVSGGAVPDVDLELTPRLFGAVSSATASGLIRSLHDLSEGGLAVAAAEMAIAGDLGIDVYLGKLPAELSDLACLFSESPSRWLAEVEPGHAAELEAAFEGLPLVWLGEVVEEQRFTVRGRDGRPLLERDLATLERAWREPLARGGDVETTS